MAADEEQAGDSCSMGADRVLDKLMVDTLADDVLFVTASGLGMEQLIVRHLRLYSDPSVLVFVINTTPADETYFTEELVAAEDVLCAPRVITADVGVNDRRDMYLCGGVQFVTSRILVMDLLTDRVPVEQVSGIVVCRAHRLLKSYQESFILRLFRQKKPGGFVKAFTDVSVALGLGGFGQLQKLMTRLFVRRVHLLPRFELDIKNALDSNGPELIEVDVRHNSSVKQLQDALCDVIRCCLRELRQCSPGVNVDSEQPEWMNELCAVSVSRLERELREAAARDQLGDKTRRLLDEMAQLRELLKMSEQSDITACYETIRSLTQSREAFDSNSGWLHLPSVAQMMDACEKAVGLKSKTTNVDDLLDTLLDANAKWRAFETVIKEIKQEVDRQRQLHKDDPDMDVSSACSVLVMCANDACCEQVNSLLTTGSRHLAYQFYRSIAPDRIAGRPEAEPNCEPLWQAHRVCTRGLPDHLQMPDSHQTMELLKTEQKKALLERKRLLRRRGAGGDGGQASSRKRSKQLKLTQFDVSSANSTASDQKDESTASEQQPGPSGGSADLPDASGQRSAKPDTDPWLVVKSLGHRYSLLRTLHSLRPTFIILYNCDLFTIRLIEWFKSCHPSHALRLYWLMCRGSTEEHRYLSWLRQEQEAFERLIHERGNLLIPREYDVGRDKAMSQVAKPASTRQAGGQANDDQQQQQTPVVVVDSREFNSELPLLLYKRGIDVVPITLQVGDYILTPDVAVERKALADLTQSLINGRVYTQTQQMCDHYARPILLVEGGANEKISKTRLGAGPFCGELSKKAREVRENLTLLLRQFPKLRLLWALEANISADLFEEMKLDKEQPNADDALAIRSDEHHQPDNQGGEGATFKLTPVARKWLLAVAGGRAGERQCLSLADRYPDLASLCRAAGAASGAETSLPSFLTTDFRTKT